MEKEIKICFKGLDSWGRPVFKEIDGNRYYGSVDILPDSEDELNAIVESDLVYFGSSFDCEPYGDAPGNIKIVRN